MSKKPYSFRRQIYMIVYGLITLELLVMVLYFLFFTFTLRRNTYEDMRETLQLYNAHTSENLTGVDYYLTEISTYDNDFSLVAAQTNVSNFYTEITRIQRQLEFSLRSFPSIRGLFVYFPRNATFTSYADGSSIDSDFRVFLRESLRNTNSRELMKPLYRRGWKSVRYEGETYLLRVTVQDSIVIGAWTTTERLASALTTLKERSAEILFIDEDGCVLPDQTLFSDEFAISSHGLFEAASGSSGETFLELITDEDKDSSSLRAAPSAGPENENSTSVHAGMRIPLDKEENAFTTLTVEGKRYLIITEPLEYCDYRIAALVPLSSVEGSLYRTMRFMLILVAATFFVFIFLERILNRFLSGTVRMMEDVTDAVVRGDADRRIELDGQRCVEIRQIAESYNHMMDDMQALRIHVYEESLAKKNFQLQFLRSQVAPHFLINCLNMISYLADGTKAHTTLLRSMITSLSGHLRYTLGMRDTVPLSEELEYENNYVELSKMRFPDCITYIAEIDPVTRNAQVFPLILIMFSENTFKYHLIMGEQLTVIVRAGMETNSAGARRLHLTHIDSGDGFPEDLITWYRDHPGEPYPNASGTGIGLQNIHHRLQLYYGDSASIRFSNEPGMGARIDIDIPFVEYNDKAGRKTS